MKVKEYLIDTILKLEEELKHARNEKAGTAYGLQKLQEDVIKLNEKIEQYQIEREHIKQIITCNIVEDVYVDGRYEIDLNSNENDFKTLLAILDIKPEDYKSEDVEPEGETIIPPHCCGCKYEHLEGNREPCVNCIQGDKKEVTPDAKTKD